MEVGRKLTFLFLSVPCHRRHVGRGAHPLRPRAFTATASPLSLYIFFLALPVPGQSVTQSATREIGRQGCGRKEGCLARGSRRGRPRWSSPSTWGTPSSTAPSTDSSRSAPYDILNPLLPNPMFVGSSMHLLKCGRFGASVGWRLQGGRGGCLRVPPQG
jgi:hypothetical protein